MDKKMSFAVCIVSVLVIVFFGIIGSSFYYFKFEKQKITVLPATIISPADISVLSVDNQEIGALCFSEIKLGIKPATGELDEETKIPVTVTDKNGSEGVFAKFIVNTSRTISVKVNNLQITGNKKIDIDDARENLWVSIKEIADSTKNFEEEELVLGDIEASGEPQTFTFLFWLGSTTNTQFNSCKISFSVVLG